MSIFSKMEKNSDIFWENNNVSQQKMSISSKMEKNSDKIWKKKQKGKEKRLVRKLNLPVQISIAIHYYT
jgi:hypothetical protein